MFSDSLWGFSLTLIFTFTIWKIPFLPKTALFILFSFLLYNMSNAYDSFGSTPYNLFLKQYVARFEAYASTAETQATHKICHQFCMATKQLKQWESLELRSEQSLRWSRVYNQFYNRHEIGWQSLSSKYSKLCSFPGTEIALHETVTMPGAHIIR